MDPMIKLKFFQWKKEKLFFKLHNDLASFRSLFNADDCVSQGIAGAFVCTRCGAGGILTGKEDCVL